MTEDTQEADKAQLDGDIEALERMLAQMEGEEVELRAMLQPSMIPMLQRSDSLGSTGSGGAGGGGGGGVGSPDVLDVTPFGVQQKLASLFKLRQKARELCGEDSEDEDPLTAPKGNRPHGLPSGSPSTRKQQRAQREKNKLLTPKEKAEVREKRHNLLAYVACELGKVSEAVSAELDRRVGVIAEANSLAGHRHQAVEKQFYRKVVSDRDLEPILVRSSRTRKTGMYLCVQIRLDLCYICCISSHTHILTPPPPLQPA